MFDGDLFQGYTPPQEITLRPLQEIALEACRNEFRTGTKRFILKANCGFGKTVLSAFFTKEAVKKGLRVMFVVDRIVLAWQTDETFSRYGISCGIWQADNPKFFPDRNVQIGSVQTLNRRDVGKYDLIIIDEVHSWYSGHIKILNTNPEAFVIGLSATPYTKSLGKYFETFIEPVSVKDMVKQKELVPFEIFGPSIADLSKLKVTAGDYTESSLSDAFDKADIVGDVVTQWKKHTNGKKTIVFGVNVAHIKHLSKRFIKAGVKACQINAYQLPEERKEALDGFLKGDTLVLCSVEVATKGFDCPSAEVSVLAVATKSHIKWEQTCGRVLRIFPGKEKAIILDLGGNAERLGWPDEYEFLQLDDGKKHDSKSKLQDKQERLPTVCKSCDFLKASGVYICPRCGFKPEFIQDVKFQEGELEKIQRKECKKYTLKEKKEFLGGLNQYAEDKRWKQGRKGVYGAAIHKFKEKFGCAPSSRIPWNYKCPINEDVKKFIQHQNIKWANSKRR